VARCALPGRVGSRCPAARTSSTVVAVETERQLTEHDHRSVVVGVDGSRAARAAVRAAAVEAAARGTTLEVVLAFPWGPEDDAEPPTGPEWSSA